MAEKHTIEFYEWREVVAEVEQNSGKRVRDWAGRYQANMNSNWDAAKPNHDFWHVVLDEFSGNNSFAKIDFQELFLDNSDGPSEMVLQHGEWVADVAREFIKVVGPGSHTFRVYW